MFQDTVYRCLSTIETGVLHNIFLDLLRPNNNITQVVLNVRKFGELITTLVHH